MSKEIFKREIKNIVYSKRFIVYLLLIYLPLAISIYFSNKMYHDPSIIEYLTSYLPNQITEVNPKIAHMIHLDLSTLSIALVAILHASGFIAGEREKRVMPLLVSKPIKRWKILFTKYTSFISIFWPLLVISTTIMAVSIYYLDIGLVRSEIFIAYLVAALIYGLVYTNITTLFSSLTKKTTYTNLFSFVFLIGWITLDFLITYLPYEIKDIIEEVSLSHHINKVIGYITDGEAALFATGAEAIDPTLRSLIYTVVVFLVVLTALPLLLSNYVFKRTDIGS